MSPAPCVVSPFARPLEVAGLFVGPPSRRLLEDISFQVDCGEFACLSGPNGGGKSTLLRAVLGLMPATGGSVRLFGQPPEVCRSRVGYMPQRRTPERDFPATPAELLTSALRGRWPLRVLPVERQAVLDTLRECGAESLADRPLAMLSGGELQRVYLARAVISRPPLLLLDEPFAGLDRAGRQVITARLQSWARDPYLSILMVTHDLTAVGRLADRVIWLDRRVLAWGAPAAVLRRIGAGRGDHQTGSSLCEPTG